MTYAAVTLVVHLWSQRTSTSVQPGRHGRDVLRRSYRGGRCDVTLTSYLPDNADQPPSAMRATCARDA